MFKQKKSTYIIEYDKLFLALNDICLISFNNIMKPELYKLQQKYEVPKLLKYNPSIQELKGIYKKFHIGVFSCLSQTYINSLLFYFNQHGLIEIIMSKGQVLTTKYFNDILLEKNYKENNAKLI